MVRMIQCVCRNRHVIFCIMFDPASTPNVPRDFPMAVEAMIANHEINPFCHLCNSGSAEWTYPQEWTVYRTIDEARPYAEVLAINQMKIRAVADNS